MISSSPSDDRLKKALSTWIELNAYITGVGEEVCNRLLFMEKNGKARKMFLRRIHSRLNRVRAQRERAEMERG